MAKEKILVVEDDKDILELVNYNLTREGYEVVTAKTGEEGLHRVSVENPDLIILDLMLPGMDGLDVCKRVKSGKETKQTRIVMLTAKGEESDIVTGLELGADDYITKPFSPKVLVARIRAVLRRQTADELEKEDVVTIHDIYVHAGRHEVSVGGKSVDLTSAEFNILYHLAGRPGWVFTRNQIVEAIHGDDYSVTERSVDVHIVGLRKKLGSSGKYIQTVRGVGYKMKE